jgi:hypothetical protein
MSVTFLTLRPRMPALLRSGLSLHLKSSPGVGKSEFIDQVVVDYARALGKPVGVAKMFIATASPMDLMGYMVPGYRGETRISEFTQPIWMQTYDGLGLLAEFEHSVLVLEEFGQGEGEVKRASADLFLNHRIGPHKLPANCSVIALSNRNTDRSGVTKDYDFRINREVQYEIQPDATSWEAWANENNVHPIFRAFAMQHPDVVFASKVPDIQGPWCTPRSLMMLERAYRALGGEEGVPVFTDKDGRSDPVAFDTAAGTIGMQATAALVTMIRMAMEMPKYVDIIAKPKTTKVPERPDACMLVCYQLAHRCKTDEFGACAEYVQRMPAEFAVLFVRAAVARDTKIVNTKAFGEWTRKNGSLMVAINQ